MYLYKIFINYIYIIYYTLKINIFYLSIKLFK